MIGTGCYGRPGSPAIIRKTNVVETLTKSELYRIKKHLKSCPGARLVYGVKGLVTYGGYAIEFGRGGVIHPKAFLDLMDGSPDEPIDILKKHTETGRGA